HQARGRTVDHRHPGRTGGNIPPAGELDLHHPQGSDRGEGDQLMAANLSVFAMGALELSPERARVAASAARRTCAWWIRHHADRSVFPTQHHRVAAVQIDVGDRIDFLSQRSIARRIVCMVTGHFPRAYWSTLVENLSSGSTSG